ncbi:AraC family transcriptional regulator [Paenibacillus baekrokdamisoli]|uniref:AraC family transcriptional regulator n=1 Tax=Paenibacillus baekrokdamisoli TaxID=1712516 RepID=A0A3G9IVD1_9BACL|nr:AraC family transcriptional regulator [Paenibacillus baekrokdamisoli]MBB3070850.1 AraC-like DNA-binding protein/mannose-6-phosphate isomerase-like protein (cupin superfamily) [Paenibacillus baekrokdamisoli]BBH22212.1 AraC family transcriptional regulator [Paenibacillus baekrokdamisoli]
MYPEMRHEQVVYQNPFLAMRIWQIDSEDPASEETFRRREQDWRQKRYTEWHYHEEVEFLLILKGELTAFYREEQLVLRKGDIALFGSSEPHTTMQTKEGNMSQLVFQIDLRKYWDLSTLNSMQHFSEVIRPLSSLNYIYRDNRDVRTETVALIREIYREMNDAQIGYELAVSSRIKNILLLLLRHDTQMQLNYNDNRLLGRLQPAVDYVEKNLSEKLSVSEISGLVNMSYTHFIKTFKKAVGMSFTDFVVYKRIKKAEQQLLTNDVSIAEVAESVGISNLGHFYAMFRRFNDCSPKQFKERLRALD